MLPYRDGVLVAGTFPRAPPDTKSSHRFIMAAWGLASFSFATSWRFRRLAGDFAMVRLALVSILLSFAMCACVRLGYTARRSFGHPHCRQARLVLFTSLAPLLVTDLARDYAPCIVATDAAPEFGLGVALAPATVDVLSGFDRRAERWGDFVRLSRDDDPDAEHE